MNHFIALRMAFRTCAVSLILLLFTFGTWAAAKQSDVQLDIVIGGQPRAVVLIPEPDSFTGPIPGWSPAAASNGKIALSNAKKHGGAYSLQINDNDTKSYAVQSDYVGITAGQTYTVTGSVYLESGAKPSVFIRYYDANKTMLTQSSVSAGTLGQWTDFALTKAAPASAVYAAVLLYADTAGIRLVYFDDIGLTGPSSAGLPLPNPGFELLSDAASDTLVQYVKKSTGAMLPIMTEAGLNSQGQAYQGFTKLYVGTQGAGNPDMTQSFAGMDGQGFVICPHKDTITIIGPTKDGTLNGVFEFLERYVGVRWLMPGPNGEDVPQSADLSVPPGNVREQPVFANRVISPAWGDPATPGRTQAINEWAQRNKLQGFHNQPFEYKENLHQLFPAETYGTMHPEFYPNGVPPAPGVRSGWQPCFSVPGTVDAAVYGILQYFKANPDKHSYSLGVNDTGGFCEANPSHPSYPNATNSMGYVNMSNIYYDWVNKVAERVLQVYPDKWFGLLAYREVNDPPSFALNTRVVPFLTKDRMAWVDEGVEADEHARTEAWNPVASQIGWYDYMYGSLYLLPRIYVGQTIENWQYAADHHVVGTYTEMYPTAGDGPKAWLMAKLLWNPDRNPQAQLDDWYIRAVGPLAAPDLKAYFGFWENFWTERAKGTAWFEKRKSNIYFDFLNHSYLNMLTEQDLHNARTLMDSVVAKAGTAPQQARAQIFRQAFDYYELTARSFPRKGEPIASEADALDIVNSLPNSIPERLQLAADRINLISAFESEPALRMISKPAAVWSGWNGFEFAALADYMAANEPGGGTVTNAVYALANGAAASRERDYAKLLLKARAGTAGSLTANPSFESGTGTTAASWQRWIDATGTVERVTGTYAHSGTASLKVAGLIAGAKRGGAIQSFTAHSGLTAASVYYYSPAGTATGNIQLYLYPRDSSGKRLATYQTIRVDLADTAGQWSNIGLLENIPSAINGKQVADVQLVIAVDECDEIYLDDAAVYQQ
ncbi:DUF4838 domain-containing protein [Paenibacillus mesophilus]|uniref:DUF4838 domain-containing protein n=1 Tax=Paenibacillus mesophilus TaxID=2582849 RepID=UPI00130508B5|nr:DUF4838 domain-containing protein [Paenibacillus mesophilus]